MNTKNNLLTALICTVALAVGGFIVYETYGSPSGKNTETSFTSWLIAFVKKTISENQSEIVKRADTESGSGWDRSSESFLPSDTYLADGLFSSPLSIKRESGRDYGLDLNLDYIVNRKRNENLYGNTGGIVGASFFAISGSRRSGGGSDNESSSYGGQAGIRISGGTPMTNPFSAPNGGAGSDYVNPGVYDKLSNGNQLAPVSNGMYILILLALLYAAFQPLRIKR